MIIKFGSVTLHPCFKTFIAWKSFTPAPPGFLSLNCIRINSKPLANYIFTHWPHNASKGRTLTVHPCSHYRSAYAALWIHTSITLPLYILFFFPCVYIKERYFFILIRTKNYGTIEDLCFWYNPTTFSPQRRIICKNKSVLQQNTIRHFYNQLFCIITIKNAVFNKFKENIYNFRT